VCFKESSTFTNIVHHFQLSTFNSNDPACKTIARDVQVQSSTSEQPSHCYALLETPWEFLFDYKTSSTSGPFWWTYGPCGFDGIITIRSLFRAMWNCTLTRFKRAAICYCCFENFKYRSIMPDGETSCRKPSTDCCMGRTSLTLPQRQLRNSAASARDYALNHTAMQDWHFGDGFTRDIGKISTSPKRLSGGILYTPESFPG
jgi:hypothetical protein